MVVWPSRQPGFDDSRFVSGVIVHYNMNVEAVWDLNVDLLEKIEKLCSSMALVAFADHEARKPIRSMGLHDMS